MNPDSDKGREVFRKESIVYKEMLQLSNSTKLQFCIGPMVDCHWFNITPS